MLAATIKGLKYYFIIFCLTTALSIPLFFLSSSQNSMTDQNLDPQKLETSQIEPRKKLVAMKIEENHKLNKKTNRRK